MSPKSRRVLRPHPKAPPELPGPDALAFDLDSYRDKSYLTHNFHPYPAKFVPQIPAECIARLSRAGETVLDPFCGSGTTLVEAALLGRHSAGIDLHPLACLIARVKTTTLSPADETLVRDCIHESRSLRDDLRGKRSGLLGEFAIPVFKNRDHWFLPHVQVELAAIKAMTDRVSVRVAREFLQVAFAAIIVKVSNQDSDTRWVAVEKAITPGVALGLFVSKAEDMLRRIATFSQKSKASVDVTNQSATERFAINSQSIDLVVTSPPYMNSYDYYLYHKLRLFWLGMDHLAIQEREVGSRNRHSDHKLGTEAYADELLRALKEVRRVLRERRYLCIVIGDSVLRGTLIDMGQILRRVAGRSGFEFVREVNFEQRKYTSSFTRGLKTTRKLTHIIVFRSLQ